MRSGSSARLFARSASFASLVLGSLLISSAAQGDELPSFEKAAALLEAATVTVRVTPAEAAADQAAKNATAAGEASSTKALDAAEGALHVTVCSGVSLGGGLVVSYINLPADARVRITLPGGEQAEAKPRVTDHFSGLTLLETDKRDLPALTPADSLPSVGQWVLSAAAWGAQEPVVSFGILSGKDRTIPGASFPPLLQCDLRTAETSSGAALVNRDGQLIGIVVATDAPGQPSRWTYAVPVSHVQRMLRAKVAGKVIVLERHRPTVGLQLTAGREPGTVIVQRVDKDGPAERAGIQVGDQVLAAEGIKIRSVYQVVQPLLQKQPGDKMAFLIQQGDQSRSIEVTLGGGRELPETPTLTATVQATVVARRVEVGEASLRRFDLQPGTDANARPHNEPAAVESDRIRLLERALEGYGVAIMRLQEELRRRDREQTETQQLIDGLNGQINSLQAELEKARQQK